MSVKSYGATFNGPQFWFTATKQQIAALVFPEMEGKINEVDLGIGGRVDLDGGAVLIRSAEDRYTVIGYATKVKALFEDLDEADIGEEFYDSNEADESEDDVMFGYKLPEDAVGTIVKIAEQKLYITWQLK